MRKRTRRRRRRPWQFSLRMLLGMIAILAVPFWLLTSADAAVRFWGAVLLVPTGGGCLGYVAGGPAGAVGGVCIAILLGLAILLFAIPLW